MVAEMDISRERDFTMQQGHEQSTPETPNSFHTNRRQTSVPSTAPTIPITTDNKNNENSSRSSSSRKDVSCNQVTRVDNEQSARLRTRHTPSPNNLSKTDQPVCLVNGPGRYRVVGDSCAKALGVRDPGFSKNISTLVSVLEKEGMDAVAASKSIEKTINSADSGGRPPKKKPEGVTYDTLRNSGAESSTALTDVLSAGVSLVRIAGKAVGEAVGGLATSVQENIPSLSQQLTTVARQQIGPVSEQLARTFTDADIQALTESIVEAIRRAQASNIRPEDIFRALSDRASEVRGAMQRLHNGTRGYRMSEASQGRRDSERFILVDAENSSDEQCSEEDYSADNNDMREVDLGPDSLDDGYEMVELTEEERMRTPRAEPEPSPNRAEFEYVPVVIGEGMDLERSPPPPDPKENERMNSVEFHSTAQQRYRRTALSAHRKAYGDGGPPHDNSGRASRDLGLYQNSRHSGTSSQRE